MALDPHMQALLEQFAGAFDLDFQQLDAVTYTPGDRAPDAGTNFTDLLREIGLKYE